MVYDFIFSHQEHYPVIVMCNVLSVSRSCYYAYQNKIPYTQKPEDKALARQVVDTFMAHRRRYGVRRLLPELRDKGIKIGSYKISRVLHDHGLKAIQPRSFVPRTTNSRHPYPISPNLLKEKPFAKQVNQVWVGGITYIPLQGGLWGYLAVWMDCIRERWLAGPWQVT